MSSEEIVLSVKNISKCFEMYEKPIYRLYQTLCAGRKQFYKEFWALRDVSLEVRRGECVGVIGRNGAGKSTLLQIITGTLQPTMGTVESKGRIGALLELGSGFNPEFTGRENVYMNAAILGLSEEETEARYQDILDFADIGDFINQPLKNYSSGMMVRLAFATITATMPEILIIDEALAVGDVFFQQKCIDFIKEKLKGTTKFMVSHDLSMLQNFSNRIIVIDAGKIIFDGDPLGAVKLYTQMEHAERFNFTKQESVPVDVRDDDSSGNGKAEILNVKLQTAGRDDLVTSPGDKIDVFFDLKIRRHLSSLVIGYFFRDRTGLQIFGANNDLCDQMLYQVGPGLYAVHFSFVWPKVKPGNYFITLGVGEGDTFTQVVECWMHNICMVTCCNPRNDCSVFLNDFQLINFVKS